MIFASRKLLAKTRRPSTPLVGAVDISSAYRQAMRRIEMFDLNPRLAVHVIEAHIADKERELKEASIVAKIELEGGSQT